MTARAGLLAALCLVCSCGPGDRAERLLDVVWVVIDAAGAPHVGYLGAGPGITPELDALAGEAVVFERAYAQHPATLNSARSFLTGLRWDRAISENRLSQPTLASHLRDRGWRTAAFSENPWISEPFGFDEGFEEFHQRRRFTAQGRPPTPETVDLGLAWLERHADEPVFLYLHLLPPHSPYAAPKRFRRSDLPRPAGEWVAVMLGEAPAHPERLRVLQDLASKRDLEFPPDVLAFLRERYRENLSFADEQVGRLLAGLRKRAVLERTLLIVSSDHGEAFGEHGQIFHGTHLYDEQIRVPLLIRFPEARMELSRRENRPVELMDVVPTVLDALGLSVRSLDGRSLLPLLRGREAPGRARAWVPNRGFSALVEGHTKLLVTDRGARLFDLASDPGEERDLAAERPERVRQLWVRLEPGGAPTADSAGARIDSETREELEALGYAVD